MSAFQPRRRRSGLPLGRILVGLSPAILLAGFAITSDAGLGIQPASFNSVVVNNGLSFASTTDTAEAATVVDTDAARLASDEGASRSVSRSAAVVETEADAEDQGLLTQDPAAVDIEEVATKDTGMDIVVADMDDGSETVGQPTWSNNASTRAPLPEGAPPRRPLTRNGILAPVPTPRGGETQPVGQYMPAVPVR